MNKDFADLVKEFHQLCDMQSYSAQFNVFCWLFQQNPQLCDQILAMQRHKEEEEQQQMFKIQQQQQQQLNDSQKTLESIKIIQNQMNTTLQDQNSSNKTPVKQNNTTIGECSVNDYKTPDTSSQHLINKTIDNIKFPSGLDFGQKLRNSINEYKQNEAEAQDDDEYNGQNYDHEEEDGEYYDEEEYEYQEEEEEFQNNNNQDSKQDTFLSCEDNNQSSGDHRFNNSTSMHKEVSGNDLQILCDLNGTLFDYDFAKNIWFQKGAANCQIVADELSDASKFNAHVLCTVSGDKRTVQFDLTENTLLMKIKNSINSLYWFDKRKHKANKTNTGAIKFFNEQHLIVFENQFKYCMSKMNNAVDDTQPSQNWSPKDSL